MFTYLHCYYDQNEVGFWLWKECIHLWWHSNQSTVSDHRYNTHCFKSQLKEKENVKLKTIRTASIFPHPFSYYLKSFLSSKHSKDMYNFFSITSWFSLAQKSHTVRGISVTFGLNIPNSMFYLPKWRWPGTWTGNTSKKNTLLKLLDSMHS